MDDETHTLQSPGMAKDKEKLQMQPLKIDHYSNISHITSNAMIHD